MEVMTGLWRTPGYTPLSGMMMHPRRSESMPPAPPLYDRERGFVCPTAIITCYFLAHAPTHSSTSAAATQPASPLATYLLTYLLPDPPAFACSKARLASQS